MSNIAENIEIKSYATGFASMGSKVYFGTKRTFCGAQQKSAFERKVDIDEAQFAILFLILKRSIAVSVAIYEAFLCRV